MTKKQFILAVAPKLNCSEPCTYSTSGGVSQVNFLEGSGYTEVFCDRNSNGVSIKFKGRRTQFDSEVVPDVETLLQDMGIENVKVDFYNATGTWGWRGLPVLRIRCADWPWNLV